MKPEFLLLSGVHSRCQQLTSVVRFGFNSVFCVVSEIADEDISRQVAMFSFGKNKRRKKKEQLSLFNDTGWVVWSPPKPRFIKANKIKIAYTLFLSYLSYGTFFSLFHAKPVMFTSAVASMQTVYKGNICIILGIVSGSIAEKRKEQKHKLIGSQRTTLRVKRKKWAASSIFQLPKAYGFWQKICCRKPVYKKSNMELFLKDKFSDAQPKSTQPEVNGHWLCQRPVSRGQIPELWPGCGRRRSDSQQAEFKIFIYFFDPP